MKLLIGGDYLPDNSLYAEPEFPQKYFGEVLPLFDKSDLVIFNLESVISGSGKKLYKTGVSFNSKPEALGLFERENILLTLANNHIYDFGKHGLESTIAELVTRKINYVGAGLSREEAQKPATFDIEGKTLGILNYCEHEFSTADNYMSGANGYSPEKVFYDIRLLQQKCDKIIVIYHGNIEYYNYPSPELKKRLRFIADLGADAVFCHHAHYFSGYEVYENTPIFYGLGNFYTKSNSAHSEDFYTGIMVQLEFSESTRFYVIPYHQNFGNNEINLLAGKEKEKLEERISDINHIISDDALLSAKWLENVNKNESKYYYILKQQNKFVYKLVRMGLLKNSRIARKYLAFLMNIIRNESHREAVLTLLKKDYDRYNEN